MAFQAGFNHYFSFYEGTTGLVTTDFTVDYFQVSVNSGPLQDVDAGTLASLQIVEVGGGYYYAHYHPTSAGFYFIAISRGSFHGTDAEDISDADFVSNLTQNTGGPNALRPTLPSFLTAGGRKPHITEYILMVFSSDDWDVGRTKNADAIAMTKLDEDGNWLTSPLPVSPGTYHIVVRNNFGMNKVIKAYLQVGEDV